MPNLDAGWKKYYACVRRELKPYSFGLKKKALETLENDLRSFQDETPEAGYDEICRQFGHPNKFAEGLLDVVEPEELKRNAGRKRKMTLAAVLLLAVLFTVSVWGFMKAHTTRVTHTVETTIVFVE